MATAMRSGGRGRPRGPPRRAASRAALHAEASTSDEGLPDLWLALALPGVTRRAAFRLPAASIARTANSWRPGFTRTFAGELQALNGAPSSAHSNRSPRSWLPAPKANRARSFAVRFAGVSSSLVLGAVASRLIVTVFAVTPPALVAVQLEHRAVGVGRDRGRLAAARGDE